MKEEIEYFIGMMESAYTYGGMEKDSHSFTRYLLPYKERLGDRLFNALYDAYYKELRDNYEVIYNVGTDSEGVTYNSLKRKS